MSPRPNDIQGRFLLIPYDWRAPTLAKIARRWVQPGGPMFVPKVFGWGWTLNLAHRGTQLLLLGTLVALLVALVAG